MITDRKIQAAIKACTGETILNDGSGGRGTGALKLVIRKGASGAVTAVWFATWKMAGRRRKKSLGRYPDVSLKSAREKFANEIRPAIQAGKNPAAIVRQAELPTVENLFMSYVAALRAKGAPSADEVNRILLTSRYAAVNDLGRDRAAGDIEAADVSAFLAKRFATGARRQTDLARTFMSAAFNWGARSTFDYRTEGRRDWGIKFNPVALVPRDTGASKARDRNLSTDELAQLWAYFSDPDNLSIEVSSAILLVLCCGQRVRETLRVHGNEVDLDAALWTMPAHKTKMKQRPHMVPLPAQAVEIFRTLKDLHGDGPLFPARKGSKHPYILDTSLAHAMRAWSDGAKIERVQSKDLRRTWKSRAGDGAGIDRFTRDLIQQHARGDTGSKHYDMADYLPQMREAMKKWERWLAVVVTPDVAQAQQQKQAA